MLGFLLPLSFLFFQNQCCHHDKYPLDSVPITNLDAQFSLFYNKKYAWVVIFFAIAFTVKGKPPSQNTGKTLYTNIKQKTYMKYILIFICLFNKPFDPEDPSISVSEIWLICCLRN